MATRRVEDLAPQIRSLFVLGSPSGLSDGQLLDRFATGQEPASSLAFEALVERHGSMVLRVCRGVLGDPHDAQDAFQATFLVLVRKANSIRDRESLASWLHGVALRVASHAKGIEARRRRLEREKVEGERSVLDSGTAGDDDFGPKLLEEIGRLPERYRAAVVLCYLEGHSCEHAAQVLGWPVGTVKSRLSRAKERLRNRLTRLGLAPSLALEGPPGSRAYAALSPRLAKPTTELAARFGARSSAPASASGAVVLAKGVLKTMTYANLKWPLLALLAGATWLEISSMSTPYAPAQKPEAEKKADPKPQAEPAKLAPIPAPDPLALTVTRELSGKAGSGTILMYALNPNTGNRIPENPAAGPWKEAEVAVRWVAITGIVDNQAIREAEARARNIELDQAFPEYKRVDVQRQVRKPGEAWSDWTNVDSNKNYEVLDNLPEVDTERTPEVFRPSPLVDPLPFLKKGNWSGVDPETVLKSAPKPDLGLPPVVPGIGRRVGPGQVPIGNSTGYLSPILSVRYLDFTVQPGTSYRYRVRIVLVNPKAAEEPRKRELYGPWSEPTQEVEVSEKS